MKYPEKANILETKSKSADCLEFGGIGIEFAG
jgi:hypothetical protein